MRILDRKLFRRLILAMQEIFSNHFLILNSVFAETETATKSSRGTDSENVNEGGGNLEALYVNLFRPLTIRKP